MRMHVSLATLGCAWLVFGSVASAQLTDLQPGRNFPSATSNFGGGFSENLDFGDCDNDGDLDIIVGNGGDGSADKNRIYINNGGLQGGTLGTFSDQTGTRFAGTPSCCRGSTRRCPGRHRCPCP